MKLVIKKIIKESIFITQKFFLRSDLNRKSDRHDQPHFFLLVYVYARFFMFYIEIKERCNDLLWISDKRTNF